MTEATLPRDHWRSFYEKAWDLRKMYMEKLVEEGEKDPFRIVKRAEHYERFHKMNYPRQHFNETGEIDLKWESLVFPDKDKGNVIIPEDPQAGFQLTPFVVLPTGMKAAKKSTFLAQYQTVSYYNETNKIQFIVDYAYDKGFDAIIELGAGYSQNLIKLFYEGGPKIPYFGGEYTQSGVDCANFLSSLNPAMQLQSFRYDFNRPDYSEVPHFQKVLVFTCHTIEQVEMLSASTIPSVAKVASEVHCIHFEPFGYQMSHVENEVDNNHRKLFYDRNWNKNLIMRLVEAHRDKKITLDFIGKNIAGSFDGGLNPTSIAIWHAPVIGDS